MAEQRTITADEVTSVLLKQIESFKARVETLDIGTVLQVGDGITRIYGLPQAMAGELLEFPNGVFGMAMNLESDMIGAIILGDDTLIKEGDPVRCTGRVMEVPVGSEMIGRVVNALGQPIDGKGPIPTKKTRPLEHRAPSVIERQSVHEPLQTGIKAIDAMVPIGRGQRELIIGDRHTGKTAIAIDTIINQKDTGLICVYVAIGQKSSTVARVVQILTEHGAMAHSVIVSAPASDVAPLQYIAPYSGCAIAEEFLETGKHALIVYDDLSKHAVAYREISLLLRRPPGREAYPGDVFYLHSRLLERAAKLSDARGGGSLTALPIIETQAGDISAFIPTNVISITDGQIFLEMGLFNAGTRPAINGGLSVSRVGGNAQIKAMKKIAGRLRLDLAQYRELLSFSQLSSDLDNLTKAMLTNGERLSEVLKQEQYRPMRIENQVLIVFSAVSGFLDDIPVDKVRRFEATFLAYIEKSFPDIGISIREKGIIDEDTEKTLREAIEQFKTTFR